jgi:hypothetical protein
MIYFIVYDKSAIARALLMARVIILWCLAQFPVRRGGTILACMFMKRLKSCVSL